MLIRTAISDDIPAIRALASQSPETAQWSEQHYDALAAGDSSRVVLIAEDGGAVVGFIVAHEIAGEFELENIAVATHARRRGIGRDLVGKLVETAAGRGVRTIHLEVRGQNRAARRLYEALGFDESGIRRGYYECPSDDAVLYRLEILRSSPENN